MATIGDALHRSDRCKQQLSFYLVVGVVDGMLNRSIVKDCCLQEAELEMLLAGDVSDGNQFHRNNVAFFEVG